MNLFTFMLVWLLDVLSIYLVVGEDVDGVELPHRVKLEEDLHGVALRGTLPAHPATICKKE